jgi:hypothetical protein
MKVHLKHNPMGRHPMRVFLQNVGIKAKSFASTPTHGGDTFGMELTESRRFGSSGLSVTFERLLLQMSFRPSAKATSRYPRKLGL